MYRDRAEGWVLGTGDQEPGGGGGGGVWSGLTTSGLAQWNLILKHKENCVSFLPQQKLPPWLFHGAFRLTCEYINSEELEISR